MKLNLKIGLRLLCASLILFVYGTIYGNPMAAFILAGLAMSMPTFSFKSFHKKVLGEGFTAEEEKQLEKMLGGVAEKNKELVKNELKATVEGLATKKDLEDKLLALGLKDGAIKELTDAVTKQGEEMRKMFAEKEENEVKTIEQIVIGQRKAITEDLHGGTVKSVKFVIPQSTVRKTLVDRSAAGSSTLGYRIPGIGLLDYNNMNIAPLFRQASIGPNSNGVIRYMDQNSVTRNAAEKAEGAAYAESAMDWIEKQAVVQKVTDSIPVTKEAMNDLDFVMGELDRLLNLNLALREDLQLYAGNGTAPNLKGINTYAATAQATLGAAPYVDTVDFCNIYDLIAVLKVVISTGKAKYVPNYVIMNPSDILRMKLTKDSQGRYVLPPFLTADGLVVDSIKVVESNQVTANTLTIGDFRYATLYTLGGLEIEMGYINDQFVKDSMTMKASKRECLLVRDVDLTGFKKLTDITAALALLETP